MRASQPIRLKFSTPTTDILRTICFWWRSPLLDPRTPMSHRSHSASRALIGTLETLEARQLLTTVLAVATVTTVPALSPAEVADLDFPVVNETHSITKGGKITGLVIEFSRDMAPGPVTDLRNFEVDAFRKGTRAFVPSRTSGVALKSASYDPVSHSVTLVPAAPLSLARVGTISVMSPVSGGTASPTPTATPSATASRPRRRMECFTHSSIPTAPGMDLGRAN